MYLLEHDGKQLLARSGIPVPPGQLLLHDETLSRLSLPPGPWVVKAQINAGGRGKAGLIRRADTAAAVASHVNDIIGARMNDREITAVRIEQQVAGADETYIAFMLDPATGGVRIMLSAQGGVDIESVPAEHLHTAVAPPDATELAAAVRTLAGRVGGAKGRALADAGTRLAKTFLEHEAMLLEINPLFVLGDGSWIAGDTKFVTDDNALPRQKGLCEMLAKRTAAYPEVALKLEHGFDYVVVDPEGEIGLLTTGAGLSMMLIDELRAAGLKPYNFLDIRTGGLRGETTRIVNVLRWIAASGRVRVMLINVFAGITDLGDFARLMVSALEQAPELKAPVVARLVGNGLPAARDVLAAARIPLHTDLDAAIIEVRRLLAAGEAHSC